jgi:MFS family permease
VETDEESAFGLLGKIKTYFREGFGNSYYLCYFSGSTLMCLTALPVNLYSLYYAQSIGMSWKTYGACLAATYVVSLVLAYPLGALADRFHPLRVSIGGVFVYGIAVLLGGLFAHSTWGFGLFLILHGVFSGVYVTASASLGQRLLPRERFTELGSAGGIIGAMTSIILSPLIGRALDFSGHIYRLTIFMGASMAFAATVNLLVLHRKFIALGGVNNYVAPESRVS